MVANIVPYPAYKDSGVVWLGAVPKHWEVQRIKNWLGVNQIVLSEDTEPGFTFEYLDIGSVGTGHLTSKPKTIRFEAAPSRARRVVRRDDTLISTVRTYLKAVWHAEDEMENLIVSTGFAVLTPRRETCPKFVGYFGQSEPFTNQVTAESVGIAYPAIAEGSLRALYVCVPSRKEQTAIVRFLNRVHRRIRRYIRAKKRLIKLLEEQKQAIIHQAVTGQIDVRTGQPYPIYKESGAEWLGKVPEHWDVSRVKAEFECLNRIRIPLSSTERGAMISRRYDYYGASGVIDKVDDYLFDDELLLIAEDGANLVLRNLPLAIVAIGKFWVNNHAHILKPKRGNLQFLAWLMESLSYLPWISGAAQPKLTQDRLMSITIVAPPREEQDGIVTLVSEVTRRIDGSISCAQRQIELLQEYRTRLIADVVTGKLDVRKSAARPMDESEDLESPDEADALVVGKEAVDSFVVAEGAEA